MKNPARIIRTLEHMPYANRLVELNLISQRGKNITNHRKNPRTAFLYKEVSIRWNETVHCCMVDVRCKLKHGNFHQL